MKDPGYYNIDTLGKKFDPPLSRRTIRYYVWRGLLPPPEGGGRGHYYTNEHLERLKKIVAWSKQGVPLAEMGRLLTGEEPKVDSADLAQKDVPSLEAREGYWVRLNFGPDVELSFRHGALSREDQYAIGEFIMSKIRRR